MHNEIYPIKAMIYPTYQIVNILRFDSEKGYADFYYYDDVPGIAEKMYRFGTTMIKDIMWMRVENYGHLFSLVLIGVILYFVDDAAFWFYVLFWFVVWEFL